MPNWCENRLVVQGAEQQLLAFDQAFKGKKAKWGLESHEVWGKSEKEIAELMAQREQAYAEAEPDYCFNALYPIPQEVIDKGYSVPNRKFADSVAALHNPDKWFDGYTWCTSHWGTKWDIHGAEVDEEHDRIAYSFDTAWGPPIAWLHKVVADYPELDFELFYAEPGMMFGGRVVASGGEIILEEEISDDDEFVSFASEEFDMVFVDDEDEDEDEDDEVDDDAESSVRIGEGIPYDEGMCED